MWIIISRSRREVSIVVADGLSSSWFEDICIDNDGIGRVARLRYATAKCFDIDQRSCWNQSTGKTYINWYDGLANGSRDIIDAIKISFIVIYQ